MCIHLLFVRYFVLVSITLSLLFAHLHGVFCPCIISIINEYNVINNSKRMKAHIIENGNLLGFDTYCLRNMVLYLIYLIQGSWHHNVLVRPCYLYPLLFAVAGRKDAEAGWMLHILGEGIFPSHHSTWSLGSLDSDCRNES